MTLQRLTIQRAQALAVAHGDEWWRPKLMSVGGVSFHASFTKQQTWMQTPLLEHQYLSTEGAHALARSEPVAPAEYTNGVVQWLDLLGDLVDCPTCAGNGRTTCKTCKGQQKIACPRCAHLADHRPRCADCQGMKVVGTELCQKCGGKGYESPCLKCEGQRSVPCPQCVGLGQTTCEKCEGNSKVYRVNVATKKYDTASSVTWQERPTLPQGVVDILERKLPLVREEPLDKPQTEVVEVLATRRLHYAGPVEIVRFKRMMTTTMVACGGHLFKLNRGLASALPGEWFTQERV